MKGGKKRGNIPSKRYSCFKQLEKRVRPNSVTGKDCLDIRNFTITTERSLPEKKQHDKRRRLNPKISLPLPSKDQQIVIPDVFIHLIIFEYQKIPLPTNSSRLPSFVRLFLNHSMEYYKGVPEKLNFLQLNRREMQKILKRVLLKYLYPFLQMLKDSSEDFSSDLSVEELGERHKKCVEYMQNIMEKPIKAEQDIYSKYAFLCLEEVMRFN